MQYILTIKNHEGKTVVELNYKFYSTARAAADDIKTGVAETFTYNVQIYDTIEKRVIYNENTY